MVKNNIKLRYNIYMFICLVLVLSILGSVFGFSYAYLNGKIDESTETPNPFVEAQIYYGSTLLNEGDITGSIDANGNVSLYVGASKLTLNNNIYDLDLVLKNNGNIDAYLYSILANIEFKDAEGNLLPVSNDASEDSYYIELNAPNSYSYFMNMMFDFSEDINLSHGSESTGFKFLDSITISDAISETNLCNTNFTITFIVEIIQETQITSNTVTGTSNILLPQATSENLTNFIIKGNSVQNGTPSPESPAEIQSVGDKTKNLFDKTQWQNATETTFNNINCLKIKDNSTYSYVVPGDSSTVYTLTFKLYRNESAESKHTNIRTKDRNIKSNIFHGTTSSVVVYGGETIYFTGYSTDAYLDLSVLQLELGTEATPFEPYGKYKISLKVNGIDKNIYLDEPLRKVGNYYDYIDFSTKKVVRNVYCEKIDNNYVITKLNNASAPLGYYYRINSSETVKYENTGKLVLSNLFIDINNVISNFKHGTITCVTSKTGFAFNHNLATVEEVKAFIIENSCEILYVRETAKEENIQLSEIVLAEGDNTIEILTSVAPSETTVTYNKYS